jgi:hypothetical protein
MACQSARVRHDSELGALVGCRELRGGLTILGAVTDLRPLNDLERISGGLRIGPSYQLTSLVGLDGVRSVGHLEIASNWQLQGVFLPALEQASSVAVHHNPMAEVASLHRLREVEGDLSVTANRRLVRLDLSTLGRVGGDLLVSGNPRLQDLAGGDPARVGGERRIE